MKSTPISIKQYFAFVRPAADFDEGDGVELGRLLFYRLSKARKNADELREELNTFIERTTVLRECASKYRFLDELLFHIIRNRQRAGAVQANFAVDTGLAFITSNEAGRIGKSLAMMLMTNTTSGVAAEEYIFKYPALEELAAELRWFKPMLGAIAEQLMSNVLYGVKARAALGAVVSTSDMVSDSVIIADYFRTDRTSFAHALLAMIGTNMLCQLAITSVQTYGLKEGRAKKIALEAAATLTCTKPGLDAWRVASGAEQLPGTVFSPLQEMSYAKAAEVATESVPGLVLQLVAVLTSPAKDRSMLALVSIGISAASTGLAGTSIWYDLDTDPGQRKRNPRWYGMVPDQGRGKAYVAAFVMCSLQALTRGVAMALLAVTNSGWMRAFVAADFGLFFVYKLARRDFLTYMALPFWPSVGASLGSRIVEKFVTDFTASPAFALPAFFGGAYWLSNLVFAHVFMMMAVYLYVKFCDESEGDNKIDAATLWKCAAALTTTWALVFGFFARRIVVPRYRHLLYSTVGGREYCQDRFLKGATDEAKMLVFRTNRLLWEPEIGAEVKTWTLETWARFEGEAWFDAKVKARVPDEYIPAAALQQLGGLRRKRRGSA
ncbi:hypothetical protein TeGR_g5057, partial [Tetraparma gracilis]